MFNDLSSRLTTEGYNTGSANVSSVAPHFFGLRINSVAGNYLSDYTALYNDSALHSLPIIVSSATQSLLTQQGSGVTLRASSMPWPQLEVMFVFLKKYLLFSPFHLKFCICSQKSICNISFLSALQLGNGPMEKKMGYIHFFKSEV